MVILMDTLAIYEQFRSVLGDEKAKGFAQTIGTMIEEAKNAATKDDIREFRESLTVNVTRLDAALAKLAEAQTRTEARVGRLEEVVERLAEIAQKLVIRSDRHEGTLLELKFRDRLPSYLGRFLRKARVIDASELLDSIEPKLAVTALDDFLRADVVATGTIDGRQTYLVGEISYTADEDDVMRAARRAAYLGKAGLPATALVACEVIAPQTAEYARRAGVWVWVDGRILDADKVA